MVDICKVRDDQAREIARQFCRNRGHDPDTETAGTGMMGNSLRQPLWYFTLPQVWTHLQMVAAVQSVLDPEGPVVSGPGEPGPEERDAIREAVRNTLDSAGRDNAFLGETVRRRAERVAGDLTALSVVEEVDGIIDRTPAGLAAYFFPTKTQRDPPREQLLLEEVLRRMLAEQCALASRD